MNDIELGSISIESVPEEKPQYSQIISPATYMDVLMGRKTFLIVRSEWFDKVGDTLLLKEWAHEDDCPEGAYTGKEILAKVVRVEHEHPGLMPGWSVIGIKPEKQIIDIRYQV